jgi:hypothetical protein
MGGAGAAWEPEQGIRFWPALHIAISPDIDRFGPLQTSHHSPPSATVKVVQTSAPPLSASTGRNRALHQTTPS